MIEELGEYLVRDGWNEEDAWEIHQAYAEGYSSIDEALKLVAYMDDEEHDYTYLLTDCINQWLFESGEKELPQMRTIKR